MASIHKGVEYLFFFIHQSFYYSKWSNWCYPIIIIILQYESVYLLDWPPESPDNQYHLNK
ncbi:hypothetical protein E2156_25605 [Escherichia coli]|nr:hypothetical protein [Escherichia coli]THE66947.1 hypothetical protein E2162_25995 [Escherichia coli]THE67630.1 hypothetical protein E2159_25560 [Escherichia coli]THE68493.1 hypothetical protein E2158_25690 [Escherichia coli]THE78781.1 hypothetical protein E2161_25600 [Escherichia coli]